MNTKISLKKFLFVLTFLVAIFVFVGCKEDPTLRFETTSIKVEVGETFEVKPIVTNLEKYVIEYSFNNEGIIGDKGNNKFEALKAGDVEITASLKDYKNITATIAVIVEEKEIEIKEFTVKFSGTEISDLKVKEGEKLSKPSDPVKEGYTFSGWFTDADCTKAYDFNSVVSSDLILYAKFEKNVIKVESISLTANENYLVGSPDYLVFSFAPENAEDEFVWSSSDETICTVDEGKIMPLKGGDVTITVETKDGSIKQSVSFTVCNVVTEISCNLSWTMEVGTEQIIEVNLSPLPCLEDLVFASSNTDVLTVDSQGKVTAIAAGSAVITVYNNDGGLAKAELTIEVKEAQIYDTTTVLADPLVADLEKGAEYVYNGMTFNAGYNAFESLKEALGVATQSVYVAAGEYDEDITISKSNFQLIGPNSGINPNQASRLAEAEIIGKITVGAGLENVVVKGLAFTKGGWLDTEDNVNGLEISFNNIYDTNIETGAWSETRVQCETVFDFWNAQGVEAKNIVVKFNKFSNVKETNILFARNHTVTVTNNGFYNFGLDAIRVDGGYNYGVWTFDNNVFKNDIVSGTNGIYFQSVSGAEGGKYQEIIITNNIFENIGTADATSSYNCALSIRTYQEVGLKLDILYNTFKNCINYLNLRNNGAVAETFTSNVNYNAFYGVPTGVYHRNVRPGSNDTASSNPFLTNMDFNFFATLEGSPIAELSEYSDKFLDLASYKGSFDKKEDYEKALKQLLGVEFEYVVNVTWKDLAVGSKVEAEGFTWTLGTDAFASIDACIEVLDNGGIIKVLAGHYDTELNINKDNITLIGPNYNINPQYENRNTEAVIANKITLATGVSNFTINGFEFTGAAQLLPGADSSDIAFKYIVINATSADGVVRCPASGVVQNLEFVGCYSNNNTSYRLIHVTDGLVGLIATNNYFENKACFDFLNVGGYLAGEVVIKDNTFINSSQSFLYISGVKQINALIEGNYIEGVLCTAIDFRNMKQEDGSALYTIKHNTFVKAGCDWCPIRIRTAGYTTGNSISVIVNYNKFIDSYYNDTSGPQFLENPAFSSQSDPFKVIYNCDNNYFEINGVAITELTSNNFCEAASSWANPYASADDMPEYVVESQVKPTGIQITNKIETIEAFTTHQITFKLSPEGVTNKKVIFVSSDTNVATVSSAGLVSAKSEGTCTITAYCVADGNVLDTMTITVNPKQRIEIRYEGNAIIVKGNSITIDAKAIGATGNVSYKSNDEKVATVDANGVVTGKAAGQVMITVTCGTLTSEVGFTVLDQELTGLLAELAKGNNGVIYNGIVSYIGSDDGTADYPHNIYGSANDFWAGNLPEVTLKMLSTSADNYSNQKINSLEYIVIHDTAGSGSTSTAAANAGWCTNPTNTGSSWHYTIGNDGIYKSLEHDIVGWHAGDGTSWSTTGSAEFFDTGIAYEGDRPEVTIGEGGYFYINGKKSNVIAATAGANTTINTLGMVCFKGDNGNYVIPTTWQSSGYGGPICARGGNLHSIGIETAVNMGSDVWLTWQITAKFSAQLLVQNDLAADRLWFHNNFTNKKCPNTMITADLVDEFLELVYAEYEIAKNYSDYEIKFESHNQDIMNNEGRIIAAPDYTTNVSYTITVTKDGKSESITLNILVIGKYN